MASELRMQAAWLAVLAWCGGCASAPREVPAEEVARAEARLLVPYKAARTVVCDHLDIDISPNFDSVVSRPATSPQLHKVSRKEDGDDTVVSWTSNGGLQQPLRFQVGAIDFAVLQTASLRVRGGRTGLVLSTSASGRVTETQDGASLRNWNEIQIQDGVARPR